MNIRKRFKEMSKGQKIFVVTILSVFLIGLGSAVWYLGFSDSTGLIISSTTQLIYETDVGIDAIETTNSSYSKTEVINITNSDGNFGIDFTLDTTITDVSDGCTNTDDINVSAVYNGFSISDGDSLTIIPGDSVLEITTIAKQYSCPQTASTDIILTPN